LQVDLPSPWSKNIRRELHKWRRQQGSEQRTQRIAGDMLMENVEAGSFTNFDIKKTILK
jgi:hypothetical protein